MTLVVCPNCGRENSQGSAVCLGCGTPVSGPDMETTVRDMGGLDHLQTVLTEALQSHYQIYSALGRGGMGAVFLAEELELKRPVAIKVLPPLLTFDRSFVERFRREARTAASLDHPHIVPVYRVGEVGLGSMGSLLYYIMKYVDGPPLSVVLRENTALPIPVTQAIMSAVTDALAHAHARGVIHRDIKPANIMLDSKGWVWVTDFGIAKAVDATALTQSGGIIGTPFYMSPEQAQGRQVDERSDQYSLGVVAFEMLTGEVPFSGEFMPDIMQKHCHAPLPPIEPFRPDAPRGLVHLVERLLEKEPRKRFSSMRDCLVSLETLQMAGRMKAGETRDLLRALGSTGHLPDDARVTTGVPVRRPRGRLRWIAAAAVAAIAIAAGYFGREAILGRLLPGGDETVAEATAPDADEPPISLGQDSEAAVEDAGAVGELTPPDRTVGSDDASAPGGDQAGQPAAAASGTLEIRDLPAGASVTVDGRPVAGSEVQLAAGPHIVRGEADGYLPRESEVRVEAGRRTTLSLPLLERPPPTPAAPTTGSIAVAGLPAGGVVYVDGRRRSGSSFELPPGRRIVRMEAPGYEAAVDTVRLAAGERVRLVFSGRENPAILQLRVTPWANVFVDDRALGPNSRLEDTLTAGVHRLRFERDGYATADTTIELRPGEQRRIDIRLIPRNER